MHVHRDLVAQHFLPGAVGFVAGDRRHLPPREALRATGGGERHDLRRRCGRRGVSGQGRGMARACWGLRATPPRTLTWTASPLMTPVTVPYPCAAVPLLKKS